MKPIYKPRGAAAEYGEYAVNIYTGCPHGCYYCYAPVVLRKNPDEFTGRAVPRLGIIEAVKRQLAKEQITGKLIHLCFTCDPYPTGCDTSVTREVIKAIKAAGNHVQILTKGDGSRDFDLLDGDDWYGITLSGAIPSEEPGAVPEKERIFPLIQAKHSGIRTWVSCEPILRPAVCFTTLANYRGWIDRAAFGKLNYHASDLNWTQVREQAEELCRNMNLEYIIKDSLKDAGGN